MSFQSEIFDEIKMSAANHKQPLSSFADDSALFSFGLDSLAFVALVARLEDRFGVDLFDAAEEMELPMTVGELVRFYEDRATPHGSDADKHNWVVSA